MARRDYVDGQIEGEHFVNFPVNKSAEGSQNVRVILDGLGKELFLVDEIVERLVRRVMLSERVVAEKDVVAGQVRRHAVRPVEHLHLDKYEFLSVPYINAVAGFDRLEIPVTVILTFQRFYRVRRAIHRHIRTPP